MLTSAPVRRATSPHTSDSAETASVTQPEHFFRLPALHLATFTCDVSPPLGHPLCGGRRRMFLGA
jgi:hypothetical protein